LQQGKARGHSCIADAEKRYEHSTGGAAPSAMQRLIELIDDPNPPVEPMASE